MSKWRPKGWDDIKVENDLLLFEAGADAMLMKVCEEIEKVENPYSKYLWNRILNIQWECWEEARKDILALLIK